jgi:hypothetical protein
MDPLMWKFRHYYNSSPKYPVQRVTSLTTFAVTSTAPVNSTGIYAANDCLLGLLALNVRSAKGMGFISGVKITDARNLKIAIDFWVFDRPPTTLGVDNAAWTPWPCPTRLPWPPPTTARRPARPSPWQA